jgi:hypothetical protein
MAARTTRLPDSQRMGNVVVLVAAALLGWP